jgi:ribosomal-protein-alanine N-acetyltransferase
MRLTYHSRRQPSRALNSNVERPLSGNGYFRYGSVAAGRDRQQSANSGPSCVLRSATIFQFQLIATMTSFPTLETSRLTLRELTPSDAPALFDIHRKADAMRYFGTDPLKELEEARKLIEKFDSWRTLPNPGVRWALESRATGELIGTCGLFAWNRNWCKCSVGYELAEGSQGKGFMREALRAAFSWIFEEMGLNRIEAQIHPDNAPSLRLAEQLGFRQEGLLREVARWDGKFRDLLQLGLLRREMCRL